METWLIIIIVILIVAILLDGLRRMRASRQESIHLSRNARKADLEDESPLTSSEFPSGGARVAGVRDDNEAAKLTKNMRESFESKRVTKGAPQRIPEQVSLNLEAAVPMLMDSVEETTDDTRNPRGDHEPSLGALDDLDAPLEDEPNEPPEAKSAPEAEEAHHKEEMSEESAPEFREPDEVLIVNIMAKSGTRFNGAALLEVLMANKMKFGEMDIFHRHLGHDGDAPIVFSLANMVVPGTFNLAEMSEFETPGVSLFLSLPCPGEALAAYDDMVTTSKSLAETLDGELKDENRSVMTRQTVEHGRQRVIEYARKSKLARS